VALPLTSTPQLLAPDDVFGVALANRVINKHSDIVRHLGVEHTIGASGAGEHNSVQIARAVCVYTPPLYRTDGNTDPNVFDMVIAGPLSVGFLEPPRWTYHDWNGESLYAIEFVTEGALLGFSHHAFMDAAPTYTADMLSVIKARCELVDLTHRSGSLGAGGGRVWLGNRTAINKFQKGMIVAHVALGTS
jgi:hypothetical protein